MDLEVLKKRISTYRGEGGRLLNVSDELLMEILQSWEQWTGPANGFYVAVGVQRRKMAAMLGKAKRLKRDGHFPIEEFKEVKLAESLSSNTQTSPCSGIEMTWDSGKLIRFREVEQLIDFLKKVA